MSEYITTSEENHLLGLEYDVKKLKTLQKNTASRVQIVSFKRHKTIKSVDDNCRKIRILLISLLSKIYQEFDQFYAEVVARLKKMIYSAKLLKLTEQKGIVKEHLLKSVALQFKQLKINKNCEIDIIKMFNCSPFFDEIIMQAMREENPLLQHSDCQLQSWLNRQFSIKIIWSEDCMEQQRINQLCLTGVNHQFHATVDCKSSQCLNKSYTQFLRFSSQPYFSTADQQINQIYSSFSSRNNLFSCPMSPQDRIYQQNILHKNYYTSVDTMSPLLYSGNERFGKQNRMDAVNTPQIKLFETPRLSRDLKKKKSQPVGMLNQQNNQKQRPIKLRRTKTSANQQPSFLWSILCCSGL